MSLEPIHTYLRTNKCVRTGMFQKKTVKPGENTVGHGKNMHTSANTAA